MRLDRLSFRPAKPTVILAISATLAIFVLTALAFTADNFIDSRQTRLVDRLLANCADGPDALVERLRLAQVQFIELVPPDPDRPLTQSCGLMSFEPKAFPDDFLKGLVYDVEDGIPFYTLFVEEDPKTREIRFLNGDETPIYTLKSVPDYDSRWLVKLCRPDTYDAKYTTAYRARVETAFEPSRVRIRLKLIPADYVETYAEATIATLGAALETLLPLQEEGGALLRSPLATSNIVFDAVSSVSTGIELQISYPDNFTNRLEIYSSSNLLNITWFLLTTNLLTSGTNTLTWVDVSATNISVSNRFYAAGNSAIDTDADGLADAREQFLYNTTATNRDSDSDGLVDGYSGIVTTNTYPGGAHTNSGAYVEGELTWHTLPTVTDTDDDGMIDGWEVSNGHNPTNWNDPPNVRGTVSYAGRQTGTVWVLAVTTSNSWATNISYSASSSAYPYPQTAYRFSHLESTNYWLKAWLDSNASGATNATEARGTFTNTAVVITNRVLGADFALSDPDDNTNSLPDWWEVKYSGSTTNWTGSGDPDGDQYTNFEEYQANTDPTNSASHPWNISGTVTYSGPQTGVIHVVACTSSNGWAAAQTTTNSAPGAYTLTHLPPETSYWVKAWQDSNGDGSNTFWEAWGQYASNSVYLGPNATGVDITLTDPDTDGDTLPDWWELLYGLDPLHGGGATAAAWWKLDASSGTNVFDATASANHGTLYNASNAWTSGVLSNGLLLDGTNDYVQVPDSATLKPSAGVSVGLWLKPSRTYTNGTAYFLSKRTPGGSTGYSLGYESGALAFTICASGAKTLRYTCALTSAVPLYVAGTFSSSGHRLYINGALSAETNYDWETGFATLNQGTNTLRLGAASGSTPTNFFAGLLDDVRVYDRDLTSNEVHAVYELGADADSDGLSNFDEYQYGACPTNADTDGDGLVDGPGGRIPVNKLFGGVDADGDGYVDGEQTYGSSPTNSDTDGDGYLDGWECQQGFSPIDNSAPLLEYGRVVIMSPVGKWNWLYFCNEVAASRYCSVADLAAGVNQRVMGVANSDAITNLVMIVGNENGNALRRYTVPVVSRRFDYQVPLVPGRNKIRVYAGYEYTNRLYYTGTDAILVWLLAQAIPSNTLRMEFDSTIAVTNITRPIFDAMVQYRMYGQQNWTTLTAPGLSGYPTASWAYPYGTWNGTTKSVTLPSQPYAFRVDVHDVSQDHNSHSNTLRILIDSQTTHTETRSGVSNYITNDWRQFDSSIQGGVFVYQCGSYPAGFQVDSNRNLQLLSPMTNVGYHYEPPISGYSYGEIGRMSNGIYGTTTESPVQWYGVTNMALTGQNGTNAVYLNYGESAQFRASGTLMVNAPGSGITSNFPGRNIVDCFGGADAFGVFNGNTAGDFKVSSTGCGTTIDVHVAAAPLAATLMDLDVDTDRNGTINASDDTGEDLWTTNRGALIPASHLRYPATNNVQGFPPLVVQASASVVPGQTLRLALLRGSTNSLGLLNSTGMVFGFTSATQTLTGPFTSAQTYYPVSGYARQGAAATNFDFTVQLQQVNASGQILLSDTVRFKVAPQILPWDGCAVERVYATSLFDAAVTNIPNLVRIQSAGGPWAQDYVKPAKTQWAGNQILDVFVDLQHPGASNFVSVLSQTDPVVRSVMWAVGGDGGNIMMTPSLPDAPFGKAILGNMNTNASDYFNGQAIQTNVIVLPTKWLWVGHVDEVISFVTTNTVLLADPWTAADIMHAAITNGNGTNTIWFGTNTLANPQTTQTFLQVAVATNAAGAFKTNSVPPPGLSASTNSATLTFVGNNFAPGDFLRVDNEIVLVNTVQSNDVTVSRQQGGTTPASHAPGACIYALSVTMRWNLPLDPVNVNTELAALTNDLTTALGTYHINYVKLPVLFAKAVVGGVPVFYAGSANVVNCLVLPSSGIYMQETGSADFDSYVTGCLTNAVFINIWDVYHRNLGEVHCGTATRRTVDLTTPWWQRVAAWQ